jgi:hypothetical protein
VARLLYLLDEGIPAGDILVMAPQRTLSAPYFEALRRPSVDAGGQVTFFTFGGLAQRMVDLFWPLVAQDAGFAHPDRPPTFLNLEAAQYYMARLVRPLLEQGYFETATIDRNRIYSQILDNLNKAAVVGFDYREIATRLKAAWSGDQSQRRIYGEAQACAVRFREYCLEHNLLDFSLQVEVFTRHLWPLDLCREYLLETYPHLIVENVEEDTPVAHDVLREWLPHARSALLVYDQDAGYRTFLGADPVGGYALKELCDETVTFDTSFVTSPDVRAFGARLARALNRPAPPAPAGGDARAAFSFTYHRYHPQMLDWVAGEIASRVHEEGVAPGEIVVLAPFLSDALRFALANRLAQRNVPTRSHRPSRALRDEPATRCLLTLAALAHPSWGITPSRFDVAYALMQGVQDMDLVRAQLLAEITYRVRDGAPALLSFDPIQPEMQERLTYVLGERYEHLRTWLAEHTPNGEELQPLDHFLSRLFGEVLSQPGFGFHADYDAGAVTANLIDSAQNFRWATSGNGFTRDHPMGQEYVEMVQDGVVAAQYIRSWQLQPEDAVLLAPAYTFLLANRPVDVQFWLDVGSSDWWERLHQPLTHPHVLSRRWPRGAVWTDADEFEVRQDSLYRLTLGLVRRCRQEIVLGFSELSEHGYEQQGPLLKAMQRVLRSTGEEVAHV